MGLASGPDAVSDSEFLANNLISSVSVNPKYSLHPVEESSLTDSDQTATTCPLFSTLRSPDDFFFFLELCRHGKNHSLMTQVLPVHMLEVVPSMYKDISSPLGSSSGNDHCYSPSFPIVDEVVDLRLRTSNMPTCKAGEFEDVEPAEMWRPTKAAQQINLTWLLVRKADHKVVCLMKGQSPDGELGGELFFFQSCRVSKDRSQEGKHLEVCASVSCSYYHKRLTKARETANKLPRTTRLQPANKRLCGKLDFHPSCASSGDIKSTSLRLHGPLEIRLMFKTGLPSVAGFVELLQYLEEEAWCAES